MRTSGQEDFFQTVSGKVALIVSTVMMIHGLVSFPKWVSRVQIEDGDIICFQKPLSIPESECPYPDVPSFLEYVQNREV